MTATEEEIGTGRSLDEVEARRVVAEELRTKFDVWVEKLGGWDRPGMKSDIGAMASYLSQETENPFPVHSGSGWVTNWMKLGNLGPGALPAFVKLNEIFESSPADVNATYISLIRKANGAIDLPEGVDWPFTIEEISIKSLFADDTYQRPEDSVWVRAMLLGFDERLVGAIDVSKRKGGKYAIMDGRQRVAVMTLIGKKTCWGAVYSGMEIGEEADFFFRKNRNRKQMHAFYAFRARALSGDPTSKLIEEIVAAAGYKLAAKSDDADTITAIRSIEDIYNIATENAWGNALAPTLSTARVAFYGRASALDGTLLRGLGRFFSIYGPEEIQLAHFREALAARGPVLVLGSARDAKEGGKLIGSKIDVAMTTTLAEIHNAGLPRDERISLDRIPKPIRLRTRRSATGSGPRHR